MLEGISGVTSTANVFLTDTADGVFVYSRVALGFGRVQRGLYPTYLLLTVKLSSRASALGARHGTQKTLQPRHPSQAGNPSTPMFDQA